VRVVIVKASEVGDPAQGRRRLEKDLPVKDSDIERRESIWMLKHTPLLPSGSADSKFEARLSGPWGDKVSMLDVVRPYSAYSYHN
jgi:hypothetical protein